MNTIDTLTAAHQQRVLTTITKAYQAEFESRRPKNDDFFENVATAIVAAGIARSGESLTDESDIVCLHMEARDEWFHGAHMNRPAGYTFRDYLAETLVGKGFVLAVPTIDASTAANAG